MFKTVNRFCKVLGRIHFTLQSNKNLTLKNIEKDIYKFKYPNMIVAHQELFSNNILEDFKGKKLTSKRYERIKKVLEKKDKFICPDVNNKECRYGYSEALKLLEKYYGS